MALRGNLKDFSLPDVFQLVQLSGKTGVLRISGADAEGSIWFRDGDVFFAQSNWRREQLGDRLVTAQKITPSALSRALELHAAEPQGGRRLGRILVDEGYITQQVLEAFVQEQIQDTIFDIMRWDEGDFDFEVLPEVLHEDIGLSVSVENIVMEGSRRLDEWNRIKKKVPSTDMVFKMATAPGEGTFEISLKPIEWNLLLLVDGTRSVRELAIDTRRTDFEVARIIYGLFSAGLLEVTPPEEAERLRTERALREQRRAESGLMRESAVAEGEASAPVAEAVAVQPEAPAAESVPAPAAAAPVPGAPASAPEEPAFLSRGPAEASSDDMAVFEQMMEAVLSPHAPPPAPVRPADVEIEVPVAPAFEPEPEPESEPEPEPEPEPQPEPEARIEVEPEAEAALSLAEDFFVASDEYGNLSGIDLAGIPAPPIAEEPLPAFEPGPPRPSGDFEADLRAMGLGEYPAELLEPDAGPALLEVPALADVSAEPEPVEIAYVVETEPTDEDAWVAPVEPESAAVAADEISELLATLEAPIEPTGVISSGTDFGFDEAPSAGVISTDAFLAEFDSDVGLGGGLGDELTALTGGGGTRSRPSATVTRLPEAGETHMLKRDQLVDRSLVQKIIDGIEKI